MMQISSATAAQPATHRMNRNGTNQHSSSIVSDDNHHHDNQQDIGASLSTASPAAVASIHDHASQQPSTSIGRSQPRGAQAAPIHHERTPLGRPQSWTLQNGRSLSSSSGLLLAAAASATTSNTSSTAVLSTSPPLLIPPKLKNMQRGSASPKSPPLAPTQLTTTTTSPLGSSKKSPHPHHHRHHHHHHHNKNDPNVSPLLVPRPVPGRIRSSSMGRAMSFGSTVLGNPYPRSNSVAAALSPRFWNHKRVLHHPHLLHHHHHTAGSDSNKLLISEAAARAQTKSALKVNDAMIYLDGPQVYTCQQCRTHLTSHDDIISKSFHGRNGRAYLLDEAVNIKIGPAEDRMLMTGLHSVCDIFCKRCKTLVGWTYQRAYEASQKYKEGKFIIEKINLYLEQQQHQDDVSRDETGGGVGPWRGGRGGGGAFTTASQRRRREHKPRSLSWGDYEDQYAYHSPHMMMTMTPPSPPLTNRRVAALDSPASTSIVYEYPPFYSQDEPSSLTLPPGAM
mmetsp:Transcript_1451/g.3182  ORF Transcript_1451/g.3182 Transcript_1451/m.3182 type:complete len:507 (+) Transcript_1451:306-1826(+)